MTIEKALSLAARVALFVSITLPLAAPIHAAQDAADFPDPVATTEVARQFVQAKANAAQQQQLLMVVLGANWCHDSRDFSAKLKQDAVAAQLSPRFHVLKVNVGYFETLQSVLGLFEIPALYGTPTVIVVEPETGQVLNRDSLAYWRSSAIRSTDDTLAYFNRYRTQAPLESALSQSPALMSALEQIDNFERLQGERMSEAFGVAGQLMATTDAQNPPQLFLDQWRSLGAMRGRIPDDLALLRAQARAQDAAGIDPIVLAFPQYSLFTDKSD